MLRRFGDETGQSPLDFLQQTRVDTAKRLLESPDQTVTSATEHVGYTDPASFRRLFTTRVGMTPAAYRRQFQTPSRRTGTAAASTPGIASQRQSIPIAIQPGVRAYIPVKTAGRFSRNALTPSW
jgi:hypothetical protein